MDLVIYNRELVGRYLGTIQIAFYGIGGVFSLAPVVIGEPIDLERAAVTGLDRHAFGARVQLIGQGRVPSLRTVQVAIVKPFDFTAGLRVPGPVRVLNVENLQGYSRQVAGATLAVPSDAAAHIRVTGKSQSAISQQPCIVGGQGFPDNALLNAPRAGFQHPVATSRSAAGFIAGGCDVRTSLSCHVQDKVLADAT